MNQWMELLADVPPTLTAAWAAWFSVGIILMVWFRHAAAHADVYEPAPLPVSRTKSAVRPPSSVRRPMSTPTSSEMAPATSMSDGGAASSMPVVVGDPFGDLATLLDQSGAKPEQPAFRTPGDSPILNSAGSPMLRDDEGTSRD